MSITDELRLFAADPYTGWVPTDKQQADLRAIADRIDAEHESACAEAYGNGVQSVALPDLTAYVKLPVDAEGKPIHIGDVMEWCDSGDTLEVVGIGADDTLFYFDKDSDGEEMADWTSARNKRRHHKQPTVEDALHELIGKALTLSEIDGENELVAEYAKRLTLRGDGE